MSEWTVSDERAAMDCGWRLNNSVITLPQIALRPLRHGELGYCLWGTRAALEQHLNERAAAGEPLYVKAVAALVARRLRDGMD